MKQKTLAKKSSWSKFRESLLGFKLPDYSLDIHGQKRDSIPTSDRIPGACTKRSLPKVQLPEGKTIGIAYNKGNYQVVDKSDFKSMGRKT